MSRKHFLAAMASATTLFALPVLKAATGAPIRRRHITIPPYLQPGNPIVALKCGVWPRLMVDVNGSFLEEKR